MDPFHEQLARIALDAAGSFGFALAGGYAVQAHGFLNRRSSDVDLFAEASADFDFMQAVDVVIASYLREGLQVETDLRSASFARLDVRSAAESAKVELGLDWRKNEPIRLAVGPVLHADDAVANKVCALDGQRLGTTSTWTRSWPAAGTQRTNCSTWPRITIPASTSHGSRRHSPRSTACRTACSSRTARARRTHRRSGNGCTHGHGGSIPPTRARPGRTSRSPARCLRM